MHQSSYIRLSYSNNKRLSTGDLVYLERELINQIVVDKKGSLNIHPVRRRKKLYGLLLPVRMLRANPELVTFCGNLQAASHCFFLFNEFSQV